MPEPNPLNLVAKNWSIIAGVGLMVFSVGGIYAKISVEERKNEAMDLAIKEIRERDLKEIRQQLFQELEQRVDDLEEKDAYNEGYKKGLETSKNQNQ